MIASGKEYLHLHFIVLIWGFTAILGKSISLPAVEMVFYRTLLAAIGIGLYAYFRKKDLRCTPKLTLTLLLTGFLVATHWILFFLSARISNVSISLVGIATTAFWTSIIDPLLSKRKVIWMEVILGLLVVLGLYIIFYYEFELAMGLIIAIGAAIMASIFTIINSRLVKNTNHYAITFYEMTGANLGIAIFFPFYVHYFSAKGELVMAPTFTDIIFLLLLSMICTVYAYTASIHLMKRISAFAINLSINMEPIYGMLLAFIIFKEYKLLDIQFFVGASLILVSVLVYPILNKYYRRRALKMQNFG